MTSGSEAPPADAVAWHDTECGSYSADLELWEALADEARGPVLEIGAGTGRVSLHLARRGRDVIAVEREPELAAVLADRTVAAGGIATAVEADLRRLDVAGLASAPALVIGPMHVLQTFDETGQRELVSAAARLVRPGGTVALSIIDESYLDQEEAADVPLVPDVREVDGWVFSSEPLWVQVTEKLISVRRLRQRVSPEGSHERSAHDDVLHRTTPERIERIGADCGLRPKSRRAVVSSPTESDSIVVILERP